MMNQLVTFFKVHWGSLLLVALLGFVTIAAFPGALDYDAHKLYIDAAAEKNSIWFSLPLEKLWRLAMLLGFTHYFWFFLLSNCTLVLGGLIIVYNSGLSNFYRNLFAAVLFLCPYFSLFYYQVLRENLALGCLLCAVGAGLCCWNSTRRLRRLLFQCLLFTFLLGAALIRKDAAAAGIPLLLLCLPREGGLLRFVVPVVLAVLFGKALILIETGVELHYTGRKTLSGGFIPVMHLDVVGMSALSGKSLYPKGSSELCKKLAAEAISAFSHDYTFPWKVFEKRSPTKAHFLCWRDWHLRAHWKNLILTHPLLYLKHRALWGLVLLKCIRFNARWYNGKAINPKTRLPHFSLNSFVSSNESVSLPIVKTFQPYGSLVIAWERWLKKSSGSVLFRGYFYIFLHLCALMMFLRRKTAIPLVPILTASGLLHFAGILFFSPSPNYRYLYWMTLTGWIAFWASLLMPTTAKQDRPPSRSL